MENSLRGAEATSQTFLKRSAQVVTASRVAWAIIVFGIALRASQYLFNAALYVDEGALALNIINRSFAGLLQPLDSEQAAPVGFLFLEKISAILFGTSEYSLRLFPFLFAVASLFLFYSVAKRVLAPWAANVALLLFAASGHLVYFAAQIKQYTGDAAITLLIILMGLEISAKPLTGRRMALFAAVGGTAVWFSHPSVFVLAGVGTAISVAALLERDWPRFWKLAFVYAVWVMSFAAFYLISLRNLTGNQTLEKSWAKKGTFMPLPPRSMQDLAWYPTALIKMFGNPGGLPFPLIAALVFAAGCVALFVKHRAKVLIFVAPVVFTMLASGLHQYPFGRRLLMFLIPALLIVVAAGIEYISESKMPYTLAAGAALAALLLVKPVGGATNNMIHPYARQDIKPILAYVRDHRQPGDIAYIYHHQRESFLYYAKKYGFNEGDYVLGIDARDETKKRANWAGYEQDLDRLRGRGRVWLMFSHVRTIQNVREDEFMLQHMNRIGAKLGEFIPGSSQADSEADDADQPDGDEFTPAAASVYLYDLSVAGSGAGDSAQRGSESTSPSP